MNKLDFTPEQRQEYREKARAYKELKKEQAVNLKQDWMDKNHWTQLASSFGVRLPVYYQGPEQASKYLRRMCKQLNVNLDTYIESTGCRSLKELVSLNPNYPAYAFVGMFLEYINEINVD